MTQALSYAFTVFRRRDGSVILRPLLKCTLIHGERKFNTLLIIDSGADQSFLRRDVAIDGLGLDLGGLTPDPEGAVGVGGQIKIARVNLGVRFDYGRDFHYEEVIPFHVPLDESSEPTYSLLGRNPFFYRFKITFRMGYTADKELGKFILYAEDSRRNAERYRKPVRVVPS